MIKKHGSTYWLDIWVGKKRIRRSLKTDEYSLAIERARDITLELKRGRVGGTELGPLLDRYLEWAGQTKPSSLRTEGPQISFIRSWFSNAGLFTLEAVRLADVEHFRATVMARDRRYKDDQRHEASRTTANRHCALLRIVFNRAKDWGLFSGENPVSRLKFFPERGKRRPPSDEEISRIIAAADDLARRKQPTQLQREAPDLLRFIINTGLRKSEALMLRWADIGEDEIIVRGKGARMRSVPSNAEARAVLARRAR